MRHLRYLGLLLALFLAPEMLQSAYAAVSQNLWVTVQTPRLGTVTFVQGTDAAGTYKTAYTGGTNGSKIKGIWLTSNDGSAAHLVTVQISTSTTAHCSPQLNCQGGASVNVPVNAGFAAGAPAINVMSATNWPGLPIDSDGNPYFYLSGSTQTIEITFATALTASTQLAATVVVEDF